MSNLSERQMKCLKLLWQEQEFRSAGYLAERLQVSDKTVLHDIKAIQKFLDPFHVTLIRKTGRGIYLPAKARGNQELINSLHFDRVDVQPLSVEARRGEITKRLLQMDQEELSIQSLSEEYYVSRASIVNDFKAIGKWGEKYHLNIEIKRKGRRFEGQEKNIRHAIAAWLRENNPSKNTEITPSEYLSFREDSRFVHTGFFNEEEIVLSGKMMEHLDEVSGCVISEPYYSYLRDHILICISRARRKHFITSGEEDQQITEPEKFQYAQELLDIVRKQWEISEQESYYLYKYLISSDIGTRMCEVTPGFAKHETGQKGIADIVARELSDCVARALQITIADDSALMKGLLCHIRPMLNRLKYDIHIQSSIIIDMRENYGELLGLCQSALWCISQKYSLKEVSLNEVSYIAAYYQAMLETRRMGKKILVVSNSGYGTIQLLIAKLRQYFPNFEIIDVISMLQLEKRRDLNQIDLLISTMPLEGIPCPYILVSAIMSEEDIRNIQDTISASWLEQAFSVEYLKEEYKVGRLELHTVEHVGTELHRYHSPYQQKQFIMGHCLRMIMGINTESKVCIYRKKLESDVWYVIIYAENWENLLKLLSDAYQMLCSPKGRKLTERCYSTEDLKLVFD